MDSVTLYAGDSWRHDEHGAREQVHKQLPSLEGWPLRRHLNRFGQWLTFALQLSLCIAEEHRRARASSGSTSLTFLRQLVQLYNMPQPQCLSLD